MKLTNYCARDLLIFIKEPEFLIKHLGAQECIEVSDRLGVTLLAKYPEFLFEVKEEPKRKREKVTAIEE